MTIWIKVTCAAALFTLWAVLVFEGMAPPEQLIAALRDALIGLGVFHATQAQPK